MTFISSNQNSENMKLSIVIILVVFFSQLGFSIDPLREYKIRPERFQIKYQELKLKTEDQYEINTWVMEPIGEHDKNITIVIVGSDSGNMGYMVLYAYYLLQEGYRVVTFDYRGFGDSTDFNYIPNNVYHSEYVTDFETVMNWSKKELEPDRIGVLAFSMGTLVSAIGYSSSKYDFYIGEAFVRSPKAIKDRVMEQKGKELNLPVTAPDDEMKVANLNVPILFFAGTLDKVTTIKDCLEFSESRTNARTIEYEGEHLRGANTMGLEKYIQEIKLFIDSN